MKRKRRRRQWAKEASAILRLAFFVLLVLAVPGRAYAQRQELHFNIATPRGKVSPVYMRISGYIPDQKVYERWWKEISECQGLPLPTEHLRIQWVQVNAVHFYDVDHSRIDANGNVRWSLGISYLQWGTVMIAMPYRYDEETIKHEMTHWLIYWAGEKKSSDHPRLHFDGRCGVYETYQGRG